MTGSTHEHYGMDSSRNGINEGSHIFVRNKSPFTQIRVSKAPCIVRERQKATNYKQLVRQIGKWTIGKMAG